MKKCFVFFCILLLLFAGAFSLGFTQEPPGIVQETTVLDIDTVVDYVFYNPLSLLKAEINQNLKVATGEHIINNSQLNDSLAMERGGALIIALDEPEGQKII